MLSLREKEKQLFETVAMPDKKDWRLLSDDPQEQVIVMEKANAILVEVLDDCKAGKYKTWGQISNAIYQPIDKLNQEYPDSGLNDSEACQTIALFFSVNFNPTIYHFLRHRC
jgi:hypothetical protein